MQLSRSLLTYTVGPTARSEIVLVGQLGSYASTLLLVGGTIVIVYEWWNQCRRKAQHNAPSDDKGKQG